MPVKSLNPYLNFDGTAAAAIAFYERTLGARREGPVLRFGDVGEMKMPPEHKDRVMHAMLHVGGGVIMISDTMPGMGAPPEGNVQVCLHWDDAEDAAKKFQALAADGGKVTMPFADAFWGAKFGMVTDRFGVPWMFNCETKPAA